MNTVQGMEISGAFLSTPQAAERLGLSARTLEEYRQTGEGPDFHRFGRRIRYLSTDLDAWAAARRRTSTRDTGRVRQPPAPTHARKAPRRASNGRRRAIPGLREDRVS